MRTTPPGFAPFAFDRMGVPAVVCSTRARRQAQRHPLPGGGLLSVRKMHDAVCRLVLGLSHDAPSTYDRVNRYTEELLVRDFHSNRVLLASGAFIKSEPLMITRVSIRKTASLSKWHVAQPQTCQSGSGRQRRLGFLVDDHFEWF